MVLLSYIGPEVHFRGPTEFHNQNLRYIGPQVHEFWSYIQTNRYYYFIYVYRYIYILLTSLPFFIQLVLSI